MVKDFDVSERKEVWAKQDGNYPDYKRTVCPDCVDHPQLTMREVRELMDKFDTELDCKNLFLENGKVVDQCCCYSMHHAIGYQELIDNPMKWFCDECTPDQCPINHSIIQNENPKQTDCPKCKNPVWYAKRWMGFNSPDPRYDNWIMYFGTDADSIMWEQEKKNRVVK